MVCLGVILLYYRIPCFFVIRDFVIKVGVICASHCVSFCFLLQQSYKVGITILQTGKRSWQVFSDFHQSQSVGAAQNWTPTHHIFNRGRLETCGCPKRLIVQSDSELL